MLIAMERRHHLKKNNRGASFALRFLSRGGCEDKGIIKSFKSTGGTECAARIYKRDNAFD